MNKNCYTWSVRKENCGEAKNISPLDWTRHVCVMWFPRDDMLKMILDKKTAKEKENIYDRN
jgi:hypothetical protein